MRSQWEAANVTGCSLELWSREQRGAATFPRPGGPGGAGTAPAQPPAPPYPLPLRGKGEREEEQESKGRGGGGARLLERTTGGVVEGNGKDETMRRNKEKGEREDGKSGRENVRI